MRRTRNIMRPASLRHTSAAIAIGMTAMMAMPAMAQAQQKDDEEVALDTLKIEGRTADVNPYAEEGAPYKARTSGDVRRVKPLAETPATISVLTETELEESGYNDLRTVLDAQPGITLGTGEGGNRFGDRYIIRGQEARSDVFVDGLRDPGMSTRETFAVDQIEITKGPSGTFAGRGASGGSVNAITKQANTDYSFNNVDLTLGTDSHIRGTIDSNYRISDDVAVRANLLYTEEDVPDRDPANRQRWGGALAFKANLTDTISLLADYYHLTADDRPDVGGLIASVTAGGEPYDIPAFNQYEDFQKSNVDIGTVKLRIQPTDNFWIENATRYGNVKNSYLVSEGTAFKRGVNDPHAGAQDFRITNKNGWQDIDYFVDQLNAYGKFDTGGLKHNVIAGIEYSNNQVDNGGFTVANGSSPNCFSDSPTTATSANAWCIGNGTGGFIPHIPSLMQRTYSRNDVVTADWQVETMSAYLMDTIDVTDWLTLAGGVRLDSYTFDLTLRAATATKASADIYNADLNPDLDYAKDEIIPAGADTGRFRDHDTVWNYNASITVKPTDDGIVYLSWGTGSDIMGGESDVTGCGYGGPCTVVDPVTHQVIYPTKPERSESVELGTKWNLFQEKLLLTAALFRTVKKDLMEGLNYNGYTNEGSSLNTGKLRVQGVELGLSGNITNRLSGQAGAVFMSSKVLESADAFTQAQLDAGVTNVGKRISNFANTSLNAQLRYQATDRIGFGGAVTYQSKMYGGQPDTAAAFITDPASPFFNEYSIKVPAYTTFDAFATYKINEKLSLRLNAVNLTDKTYYTAAYRSGKFAYLGDGRTVRLTLSGKF